MWIGGCDRGTPSQWGQPGRGAALFLARSNVLANQALPREATPTGRTTRAARTSHQGEGRSAFNCPPGDLPSAVHTEFPGKPKRFQSPRELTRCIVSEVSFIRPAGTGTERSQVARVDDGDRQQQTIHSE
jgi:hypothetical protein